MKKIIIVVAVVAIAITSFARPHPHGGHYRHRAPIHHVHHGHHHHSGWGRGGQNFWPGFVGGIVGGAIVEAVTPKRYYSDVVVVESAPVVVYDNNIKDVTPVYYEYGRTQAYTKTIQVWIEGHYQDVVQPNGTVVRVWIPGHYETRTVTTY